MSEEATLDEFTESTDTENEEIKSRESRFWGEVPEGWELVTGSDVYNVNPNPKPDSEPNTYIEMDALDTELPWPKYFGKRNASEYSGKTFTHGDTLFARITPCTENGKAAFVPEMETTVGIGSTEYAVLSPKTDRINSWLLYYLAKSYPVHNYAVSRMRGSTGRQRVPFSVFRRELDISLPPISEQRKIATVLYTVDRAIEKTEESIRKITRIKQGAMQDILTRGIVEGRKLRETDSNQFQQSPRGLIPKDWELEQIGEIANISYGINDAIDTSLDDGTPLITLPCVSSDGELSLNEEDLALVDSEKIDEGDLLTPGDLLFNWRNGSSDHIGKTAYFDESDEYTHVGFLLRIRVSTTKCISRFLWWYLRRLKQTGFFEQSKMQVNKSFNSSELSLLRVPIPPLDEQETIVEVLDSIEDRLESEMEYKNQLQRFKQDLMQDLLSGTVRTTDTNIEVPDEIAQHG